MLNRKRTPLDGKRFGAYLVIGPSQVKFRHWICRCDCGTVREIWHTNLTRGLSKSCGCLKGKAITEAKTTHGMAGTRFYGLWAGILARCYNPNAERYKNYGGRGIKMSDRWLSFENFYEDMFPTWEKGLSIERGDVNGDYCKENCTWIPMVDQAKNKTNTRHVETPWGVLHLSEAARRGNVPRKLLQYRIEKGWPNEHWFDPPGSNLKRRT